MKIDKKKLIIIDSNALIYRAYHALPSLTTKNGEMVNAVYGFLLVFFKTLKEFQPSFIAATFDFPGPTFRHKKFKAYKAKRPKMPEELSQQIPKIKKILKSFGIPVFEKQGFEADDIIGTISKNMPEKQIEAIIVTGDSDAFQLVDKNTKVYTLKRGVKNAVFYDEEKVKEKYQGLSPDQLLSFKSLRGDPSDNIPGVVGIGEKTAIALINEFGSLENLYEELEKNSEKIKKIKDSLKKKLLDGREQAFISKTLAKIKCNVPIKFNLEECCFGKYDKKKIIQIFKDYGFQSLIPRLPDAAFQTTSGSEKEKDKTEKIKIKNTAAENNLKLW